jgi:murein DD-endopeptidase MepM/ murein hydrolase activator NlpD
VLTGRDVLLDIRNTVVMVSVESSDNHAVHSGVQNGIRGNLKNVLRDLFVATRFHIAKSKIAAKLALHKLMPMRQRYMMTRGNRFRLRYVAATYVGVFLALCMTVMEPIGMYMQYAGSYSSTALKEIAAQSASISESGHAVSETVQNQISDGMRRAMSVIQKAKLPSKQEVQISEGETLAGVLEDAGVSSEDAYLAVKAVSEHLNPREIKAGQKIDVRFDPSSIQSGQLMLASMNMTIDPTTELTIRKEDEAFISSLKEKELVKRSVAKSAKIQTSLYGSAARAGIPSRVIAEVIRVYSWDIDFQRDIRQGDSIEVMYESEETKDGDYTRTGNVLYANLTLGGRTIPIYRFKTRDGRVDYFQPNGQSIRKTLMKTPIDGARLSSGFGMRRHPILGYNKMHKGVDFAAPTGTPIYAAGDGVIDVAERQRGYGNYIRIRHNSTLKTAYAHLHRFAKGIKLGKRVSQGDVIGYVGSTGRSTGPHLHYEVIVNNQQVNPNAVGLPIGEQLESAELKRFKAMVNSIHQQYVSLSGGLRVAAAAGENQALLN